MLRRSTCGNICCILSTATSLDRHTASGERVDGVEAPVPLKKRYRTMNPMMIKMTTK
jgi:hypothetical protein